ncbi:MAG: hypothetical protein ABIL20_08105 [candidate division WOR-3 bacterium]
MTPTCDPLGSAFYIYHDGPMPVQYAPEITFGSGNYFVVWGDFRSSSQIYGARVAPSGSVLDPSGIRISRNETQYQYYPSVTWGGTRYFVIWGTYSPSPYYVYGRFVNTDGTMASDTLRLASASASVYSVDVAYSGTNFMVVWVEMSTDYPLKARLISNTGVPIGSSFTIASPVYYFKSARVVFDGINYLVTYSLYSDSVYQLWGKKYNTSGAPVGSAFRISPSTNSIYYADVVPGANNRYLNVWSEYVSSQYDIRGNIDIEIVSIVETKREGISKAKMPSIIRKNIVLQEFSGKTLYLYDASGRNISCTDNGYFDCSKLKSGVYFVRLPKSGPYKVVKIE